jgi:hypothetical protein
LAQAKQLQEHIAAASQWTQNVETAMEENADVKTLQVTIILNQKIFNNNIWSLEYFAN